MDEHDAKIEERMDSFDKRLTALETKFDSMRGEVKEDLCDIKARLNDIYQEKVAWSEWSRMALGKIGVWLANGEPSSSSPQSVSATLKRSASCSPPKQRNTTMKKLASVFAIALFALCANARMFYQELSEGTNVLDRSVLQYGSAQLLGFECITSDDTGTYSCDVGKFMDAYRKVVEINPILATNITHVTDWWEYDWLAKETIVSNDVTMVHRYTMKFKGHTDWTGASSYEVKYADIPAGEMYPKYSDGADDGYALIEYMTGANSNKVDVFSLTLELGLIDGGLDPVVVDERLNIVDDTAVLTNVNWGSAYNPDGITMRIEYERADHSTWIEHWHNETNITQIGTSTNIYWDVVNKTCFCPVVDNASISNGISIVNLAQPINLFIGDSIKATTGIGEENPGIIRAIFRDDGGAIASDDKRKKRRSTDPTVEE